MHEVALAQDICSTVRRNLRPGQRARRVVVEVGAMSGVAPEAMHFCFGIVAGDMDLGGMELDLRLLRAEASCPLCGRAFRVQTMWDSCPDCAHCPVTVFGGRELMVRAIEVTDV